MSTTNKQRPQFDIEEVYRDNEKASEIEARLRETLDDWEHSVGERHVSTIDLIISIGVVCIAQKKHLEAAEQFNRGLRLAEKELGYEHAVTIMAAKNLGVTYEAQEKLDGEQKTYVMRLHFAIAKNAGIAEQSLLTMLCSGNFYLIQRNPHKAIDILNRALQRHLLFEEAAIMTGPAGLRTRILHGLLHAFADLAFRLEPKSGGQAEFFDIMGNVAGLGEKFDDTRVFACLGRMLARAGLEDDAALAFHYQRASAARAGFNVVAICDGCNSDLDSDTDRFVCKCCSDVDLCSDCHTRQQNQELLPGAAASSCKTHALFLFPVASRPPHEPAPAWLENIKILAFEKATQPDASIQDSSSPPNSASKLCDKCYRIFSHNLKGNTVGRKRHPHQESFENLSRAGMRGCRICSQLLFWFKVNYLGVAPADARFPSSTPPEAVVLAYRRLATGGDVFHAQDERDLQIAGVGDFKELAKAMVSMFSSLELSHSDDSKPEASVSRSGADDGSSMDTPKIYAVRTVRKPDGGSGGDLATSDAWAIPTEPLFCYEIISAELIEFEAITRLRWRTADNDCGTQKRYGISLCQINGSSENPAKSAPVPDASTYKPSSAHTGGPDVARLAGKWLEICEESHPNCEKDLDGAFQPPRCLDLKDACPRLIHSNSEPLQGPYASLSYCWGKSPTHVTLTSTNIQELGNGIAVDELPLAFREVVEFTERVGIRYLWIDSLCIMQRGPDAAADWNLHVRLMPEIYANAVVNIVVGKGGSPHAGFYSNRNPDQISPCGVRWEQRADPNNRFVLEDSHLGPFELEYNHAATRAWIYQERMFSRRIITLGRDQMFWNCRTVAASERHPGGMPKLPGSFKLSSLTHLSQANERNDKAAWYRHVENYTRRSLTKATDRLPAVAGIASRIFAALALEDDAYFAGHFLSDLPRSLLWSRKIQLRRRTSAALVAQQQPCVAPSWSWASSDCPVHFRHQDDDPDLWEVPTIVSISAKLVDQSNPFGQVRSAAIALTGPVLELPLSWSLPGTADMADGELPVVVSISAAPAPLNPEAMQAQLWFDREYTIGCLPPTKVTALMVAFKPESGSGKLFRSITGYDNPVEESAEFLVLAEDPNLRSWMPRVPSTRLNEEEGEEEVAFRTVEEAEEEGIPAGRLLPVYTREGVLSITTKDDTRPLFNAAKCEYGGKLVVIV